MSPGRVGLLLLGFLAVLSGPLQVQAADQPLQVNESQTTLRSLPDGTVVRIAVRNTRQHRTWVQLTLELLDTSDRVVGRSDTREMIAPESSVIEKRLVLPQGQRLDSMLWYRLRYRLAPESGSDHSLPAEGVMALGKSFQDGFDVRVSAPAAVFAGSPLRVQVYVENLATSRPVRSATVEGLLTLDDSKKPLRVTATTGRAGRALLTFTLPDHLTESEATLKVSARWGEFVREAEKEIHVARWPKFRISTDKPLYQPGQTLHVRALVQSPSQRPLAGQDLELRIEDPAHDTVFRTSLRTSRFGVASTDWRIPENLRLGDYKVRFHLAEDEDLYGTRFVRISRYELPTFALQVKSDQAFYLPGQNAEVEVRADYLFGKPVSRGHVKVLRQDERTWDFDAQKWKVQEELASEGDTGPDGRFTARLDLASLHGELASREQRFRDYTFAAYFTDSSTGRTEQRRFSLRITREPVHVYFMEVGRRATEGVPADFYVTTSYPDGSPCRCEIAVYEQDGELTGPLLRTTRTNRYGVTRVDALFVPGKSSDALVVVARDSQGRSGRWEESVDGRDGTHIGVRTDRTLYRPGEPVEVSITTSTPDVLLVLDVASEKGVLHSELVRVGRRGALVTLPYRPEFRGALTVAAYSLAEGDRWSFPFGAKNILYPYDAALRVEARLDQSVYRPGSDAVADLRVRTADGRLVQAVLGAVVFDRAVEERARSDGEFNWRYGFEDHGADRDDAPVAGVTRRDLERLDTTEPFPEDLDAVAEVLLNATGAGYYPVVFGSSDEPSAASVFSDLVERNLAPVARAIDRGWATDNILPRDAQSFTALLTKYGVDWNAQRDPWGSAYSADFNDYYSWHQLVLTSPGPDKTLGTNDDFSALQVRRQYFEPVGRALERATAAYSAKEGKQVRGLAGLRKALALVGVDLDGLRDPWGQPYEWQFGVSGNRYTLSAYTLGKPDQSATARREIHLWTTYSSYFAATQAEIDSALSAHLRAGGSFPQDQASFQKFLVEAGIPYSLLLDGWNRSAYLTFANRSQFSGRRVMDYAELQAQRRVRVEPITQEISSIHVRSRGMDNIEGNADDFDLAVFSRVLAEKEAMQPAPNPALFGPGNGAIAGTVFDPSEAVIPGTRVTALSVDGGTFTATTDDGGRYQLTGLPSSQYRVTFEAPGFQKVVITSVPVRAQTITDLSVTLVVSSAMEVIEVASEAVPVNTSASQLAASVRGRPGSPELLATPRLRQFFPETLVWEPQLETDSRGRTRLKFRMADSITSWKMSVVASTLDGEIGTFEKEITAFQPFFVEHSPPPILTEGDEIALPVVLRNYLDRRQTLQVNLRPEGWFALTGPTSAKVEVEPGGFAEALFPFRALDRVDAGVQQVTAANREIGDAVEKPVAVHPHGQERFVTTGDIFAGAAALEMVLPGDSIAGSLRSELKIYPNLFAHVMESVEGVLQRPYGCGEQTISSTYPSLLVAAHYRKHAGAMPPVAVRAQRYLQIGYDRLLGYRDESGGFTYWGRGRPDLALTAYALRFLTAAGDLIAVDADVVSAARQYLFQRQLADGSWSDGSADRSSITTAYIARVLAASLRNQAAQDDKREREALSRALAYLAGRIDGSTDPYVLASYALAARDAGDTQAAARAVALLRILAHPENGGASWGGDASTPFHSWGLAGTLERTALALQSLANNGAAEDDLVRRGFITLLRSKDQYGVWHSGQATINVLEAMLMLAPSQAAPARTARVLVNGKDAGQLALPPSSEVSGPVALDLSGYLVAGANRVEVRQPQGSPLASAQLLASFYTPWPGAEGLIPEGREGQGLHLEVDFTQTQAHPGQSIRCHVKVQRSNPRSSGMLLAEIGLPPGADVDRASLDEASREPGVDRYEVLPDRVVFYLWPGGAGTSFEFGFRPRIRMKARSAASVLYDYYNPMARVALRPVLFEVTD